MPVLSSQRHLFEKPFHYTQLGMVSSGIYSFRCSSKSAQTYEETTDFCKSHARSSRRNFSLSKVANWSPTTAASKVSFKL